MTLVQLKSIDDLDGNALEVALSGQAQYGRLLNTWRALMNKPDLFAVYLPFLRQVAGPGRLESRVKDISALLVAHLNHCRYTVAHRAAAAAKAGIDVDELRQAVSGDWVEFSERLRIALALTRELTLNPAVVAYQTDPAGVASEVLDAARAEFDDVELVELLMSISVWNALSRFHRAMGFELDMPAAPCGVTPM